MSEQKAAYALPYGSVASAQCINDLLYHFTPLITARDLETNAVVKGTLSHPAPASTKATNCDGLGMAAKACNVNDVSTPECRP